MNDKIKKGIAGLKNISLSREENEKMLHNLKLHVRFSRPANASYFKNILFFLSRTIGQKVSYALASILIVTLTGGTLAYASEKSLPGDILYPLKVNVVEPIQAAVATTPEQKARVETGIAEERLKEAETLSKEGKLSTSTAEYLNNDYKKHEKNVFELSRQIKNTKNSAEAPNIEQEFENKIGQHADMLKKMNYDFNDSAQLRKNYGQGSSTQSFNRNSATTTRPFDGFSNIKNQTEKSD